MAQSNYSGNHKCQYCHSRAGGNPVFSWCSDCTGYPLEFTPCL